MGIETAPRPTSRKAETTPTGDSIAASIRNRDVRNELPMADLARDLNAAHARRPGAFQQDLAKVNEALHEKGILPGVDIVGTRGQDLVTRDRKTGATRVVDASNPTIDDGKRGAQLDAARSKADIGGRKADIGPDGSGTVKVAKGDNPWKLSEDVLKSQGIKEPTANQIANYQIELNRLNGKDAMRRFHEGQEIKLPPAVSAKGNDSTQFAGDRIERTAKKEQEDLKEKSESLDLTRYKFAGASSTFRSTIPPSISKADIDYALDPKNKMDLTNQDRKNLMELKADFDKYKTPGGVLTLGEDRIFSSGITGYQKQQSAEIERKRVQAYSSTRD